MAEKGLLKIAAIICGISGLVIVLSTTLPILRYEILSRQKYPLLITPIGIDSSRVLGSTLQDTAKVSNWFSDSSIRDRFDSGSISYYSLTIPKLEIYSATIAIGGEDLSENLIHFPGTALPGKRGNSVIFGHSVLPIFFNPKDYYTIFSTLPRLEVGDEIEVVYDGIFFKYRVEAMFEVLPEDIQILEQDYGGSFLSLVTCVPPGDPRMPKRLVVIARIIPFN